MFPGLSGRTALVTGGSRGSGRACCLGLAESGANVALTYRRDKEGAEETRQIMEAFGARAMAIRADAAAEDEVQSLVSQVTDTLGDVELLVNNAGIFEVIPHNETTLEQWQRTLDINLTGTFLTTWAVKDSMIERQYGRIVNVASIAGLRARPSCIAYAVSKAGVISFTKSLAEALANENIRVNAIAPGLIDTQMIAEVSDESRQAIVEATPIPRLGTADEMAQTVLFLLSDSSSFTTGQTYVASGGRVQLP